MSDIETLKLPSVARAHKKPPLSSQVAQTVANIGLNIRWEILWILGSLTNTYILMGEASQPERLRRCALTWAVTFTAAALKFAAEKQRGWLEDGGYVTAQLVHLGVAFSCYAGYFSSK